MRIISGTARGRKLCDVNIDIRPTTDMVKESIFNIIQFDIEGRRVLDLFAGSGQLGVEALSRGAASAVFVDSNPAAVKLIYKNLGLCGFSGSAYVQTSDALRYLKRNSSLEEAFDIVFIDPPYGSLLLPDVLSEIIRFDKLNTNGIIICEVAIGTSVPTVDLPYFLHKEYKYGSTKILRYDRR
jgi:16S rRNA (guanine(966)-N(2))-methyltransferase RsmD